MLIMLLTKVSQNKINNALCMRNLKAQIHFFFFFKLLKPQKLYIYEYVWGQKTYSY